MKIALGFLFIILSLSLPLSSPPSICVYISSTQHLAEVIHCNSFFISILTLCLLSILHPFVFCWVFGIPFMLFFNVESMQGGIYRSFLFIYVFITGNWCNLYTPVEIDELCTLNVLGFLHPPFLNWICVCFLVCDILIVFSKHSYYGFCSSFLSRILSLFFLDPYLCFALAFFVLVFIYLHDSGQIKLKR